MSLTLAIFLKFKGPFDFLESPKKMLHHIFPNEIYHKLMNFFTLKFSSHDYSHTRKHRNKLTESHRWKDSEELQSLP